VLSVDVPEEALVARAIESQQELAMLDQDIRVAEANLDLAGSQWAPDLSVGGMLLLQGPSKMMPVPPDSGEEAAGVMFGISLPIWFHSYAAQVSEAEAKLASSIWAKKAHIDTLRARITEALYAVRNAERLRVLYDEQLLPHAIAALGNAEQASKGDPSRYADLLEARAVTYSFALARERAVADQFQAVARLEQLIGATLSPEVGR
jgi:outer membrane protein TolC